MKKKDNPWNAITFASVIGIDLVICMAGGYYIGKFIGEAMDNQSLGTILGVIGGFMIGIISVFFIVKQFISEDNHE